MQSTGAVKATGTRAAKRPFYGRERELAELRSGLVDSVSRRGRFFLVSGDPGIGKTRLLTELSNLAGELGAKTFWGRCWEAALWRKDSRSALAGC